MIQNWDSRTVQTVIANVCLVVIAVAVLYLRPDADVFGILIPTFLAINGYEALKQSQQGREKK